MTDSYREAIEQELRSAVQAGLFPLQGSPLYADLLNMLRYHLGWADARGEATAADAGKRLRPLICLLSCQAAGGDWHRALPAAAAIELVHNFSLIHDDIEDNSDERRGRRALWKIWGLAHGINSGDAMFVLARLALDRLERQVDSDTFADVHDAFDRATLALTQGQFLDLCFETREMVTEQDYLQMVRGKTGALLAATAAIGARVATADARLVEALGRYGENLGIAFQITDDILGIWGDPSVTGKSARSDILARKKSLPLLAGAADDPTGEIRKALSGPPISAAEAERIASMLDGVDARRYSEARAGDFAARAERALDETRLDNKALAELRRLIRQAIGREK